MTGNAHGRNVGLTQQDKETMVVAWVTGATIARIARDFKVSEPNVRGHLGRAIEEASR